jgi:hypothetical protein
MIDVGDTSLINLTIIELMSALDITELQALDMLYSNPIIDDIKNNSILATYAASDIANIVITTPPPVIPVNTVIPAKAGI